VATAGSIGIYCWQLSTFVDVVCFDLDDSASRAGVYELRGTQSTSSYRYPAVGGLAFDEKEGKYHLVFTVYFTELGTFAQVITGGDLAPSTGQGPWANSFGARGTLIFRGPLAATAGSAEPSAGEDLQSALRRARAQ
jgi:hypothetical protein